jgi:hypothetical protein
MNTQIFVVVAFCPDDPDGSVQAYAFSSRDQAELRVQDYAEDAMFNQDDYHVSIHQLSVRGRA